VQINAERLTICTTAEANQKAIVGDGGKELTFAYGCTFADPACTIAEATSRSMAGVVMGALSWTISNTSFNTSGYLWDSATGEWSWWQGAVLFVVLGAGIWAITSAAVSGDRAELVGAVVRTLLALPVSMGALWLTGTLLNIIDDLTKPLLDRSGNGFGLYATMQNLIFGGGGANWTLATLTLSLLTVGSLVLMVVFSFRNLALAALIAMGPVAFMLFPMRIGRQWVARYVAAVLALMLTTPLTIGFLMLVLRGIGKVQNLTDFQAIPLGIGMIMIGFAPLAIFGLFSFVGESVGDGAASLGAQRATRVATSSTKTIMRGMGQVGRTGARASLPAAASVAAVSAAKSSVGRSISTAAPTAISPAGTAAAAASRTSPSTSATPAPVGRPSK